MQIGTNIAQKVNIYNFSKISNSNTLRLIWNIINEIKSILISFLKSALDN